MADQVKTGKDITPTPTLRLPYIVEVTYRGGVNRFAAPNLSVGNTLLQAINRHYRPKRLALYHSGHSDDQALWKLVMAFENSQAEKHTELN